MALYISNIQNLTAQAAFSKNQSSLATTYERLSSGLRINSAKDDPAGLQISDRLTTEINGYIQGSRNVNDGISVAQAAEGALDEIKNMLQRIRTLAVQSANGTNTSSDRASLNAESVQLCAEITRIACRTTYAGQGLLCGLNPAHAGGRLVNGRGMIAIQVSGQAGDIINISGLSAGFTLSSLARQAGAQGSFIGKGRESSYFDISTADSAQDVLGHIDAVICKVSMAQGELGGVQERFDSVLRLNSTMRTNMEDARSRIRDTDYAEEASNLAQQSVLQQLMPSIMKQVNSQKSLILSLLQG
ncbi:MAG: flagellin [Succinivibrio sp.]